MSSFSDPFSAVLDANVIYGSLERDILLSLAAAGFYRPCWSAKILDEFEATFSRVRSDPTGAAHQRAQIEIAFPEACIDISGVNEILSLPDDGDRHVVFCAIAANSQVIVTENLKDFPTTALGALNIEAMNFDSFVADTIDLAEVDAIRTLKAMRTRLKNPPHSAAELIQILESKGYGATCNFLAQYQDLL